MPEQPQRRGGRPSSDGTPARQYTSHDVDAAFLAILYNGGNAKAAAEQANVNYNTLLKWRADTHADRFQELAEQHGPEIEKLIVTQFRQSVYAANDIKLRALASLSEKIDNGDASAVELAKIAQQLSIATDKDTSKILTLTGRPERVTEHRTPDEAVRKLREFGLNLEPVISVHSEEVQPAQLESSER